MKNIKYILILVILLTLTQTISAQTGGPGPAPTGAPIDGLSGILLMAGAAIFGKKLKDKK